MATFTDRRPLRLLLGSSALMIILYLTSAGFFAAGILAPLSASSEAIASCMK